MDREAQGSHAKARRVGAFSRLRLRNFCKEWKAGDVLEMGVWRDKARADAQCAGGDDEVGDRWPFAPPAEFPAEMGNVAPEPRVGGHFGKNVEEGFHAVASPGGFH